MRALTLATLILALSACRTDTDPKPDTGELPGDSEPWVVDIDGDGYASDIDCDDENAAIHPGADEVCNGIDDDCDDEVDEEAGDATTFYADTDGDGWGDELEAVTACAAPNGYVEEPGDCLDTNVEVYPGAPERCDGLDNDCDGEVDEELIETWYGDGDGDGYGDPTTAIEDCDPGSGWVSDAADCDDANSEIHPAATELCDALDNDCDGLIDDEDEGVADPATWYVDGDGDGYGDESQVVEACEQPSGTAEYPGDCDDADAAYHPGADESDCADPNDYNCDGSVAYEDADGDGFAACEECDDGDAAVHPDATELCDNIDNDCDGSIDEDDATDATTWYADADGDGYGDPASTTAACDQPTGFVAAAYASDCDDGDAAISPVAEEICNELDDDCDGLVDDEDSDTTGGDTWYVDADGDGYGGARMSTEACEQPDGWVADATDCDDGDASAYPGGTELCDGADNDCDGTVDEDDATDASTWYTDADTDGFGDPGAATVACTAPSGTVADATDCDDGDATVNPEAQETCDGADNDCDGLTDDADDDYVGAGTWYADADGDGYGDAGNSTEACELPAGYSASATDCDDGDATIHPAADEICDGLDNDCDGLIDDDDGSLTGAPTWYIDYDGDGWGGARIYAEACVQPSGYVADYTDCDDTDASIFPGGEELCDGVDNDCDGATDEGDASDLATWYADTDGDGYGDSAHAAEACTAPSGYVADPTDCDDGDAAIHPAASELCNGADDDCDGLVDDDDDDVVDGATWTIDADGDGYGAASGAYTTTACSQPSGFVADSSDCDDLRADSHPGADELCDGADNDCDGTTDEDEAIDALTFFADDDGDGYGDAGDTHDACTAPSGYVADATDCDDGDAGIHPGASEVCDGVDDDCDGLADDGVMGSDSICAAASCLEVLEDGSPTGSGDFWLLDRGGSAYEEYCDFGTVGGGWAYRVELEIENTTGSTLYDHQVEVVLDSAALIAAGKLQGDGADLRFFTHDGPLMAYWVETTTVDSIATSVWVTVPTLPAAATTAFTLSYGNPDTERKSFCWHYDSFDASSTGWYENLYDASWNTPSWIWDTASGVLSTDSTNMDYFLVLEEGLVELGPEVYVETKAIEYDDDAVGVVLVDASGALVSAVASNDYDGVAHSDGQEAIMENSGGPPSGHYTGTYLLELGDIASPSTWLRVGLYWDGSDLAYVLEGAEQGAVMDGLDVVSAGVSSFASQGSPGASYDYLWVGSGPIDFDPSDIASDGLASLGSEQAF